MTTPRHLAAEEGWRYEHNYHQQVSYAQLIVDGALVVELHVDGEGHDHRISEVVADWEIARDDATQLREPLSTRAA